MKKQLDSALPAGGRRAFLRAAAGAGAVTIGGSLLAACGGGSDGPIAGGRESGQTRTIGGCSSKSGTVVGAAGNTVAWIDVINDATHLSIIVLSPVGCTLGDIKLWVGTDLQLLPMSGGTPDFAAFPWKQTAVPGAVQHEVLIPLASLGIGSLPCGAAPVTVQIVGQVGTTCDTGTVSGAFELCCSDTPVTLPGCETAFAKGGYVFTTDPKANPEQLPSLRLTRNRWGWAIHLTATGTTSYPIYAGAGLNKTAGGKQVGTLTVTFDGSQATVNYALASGVTMTEAHLYAGDGPPTTIAPGQYGHNAYFATPAGSHSFSVPLADANGGGVWLIAHAVVC